MNYDYDLIIIGAGPAGYTSAIRAAQLGLNTAIIESRTTLGGTCLNVGCIPSKTLLHASHLYDQSKNKLAGFGIKTTGVEFDLSVMMQHKNNVVDSLTKGISFLMKKNKITLYQGCAAFSNPQQIIITADNNDSQIITGKNILIATGSASISLPGLEIDEQQILSSTGALSLSVVPEKLVVIGAGVIGLELGSLWQRLGSSVTIIEAMDRIVPAMDGELAKNYQRILSKQGLKFLLSTKVTAVDKNDTGAVITCSSGDNHQTIAASKVLVAIGRKPLTVGLNLAAAGIATGAGGRIEVDQHYRTNLSHIYAVGDVIGGMMLAHKAEEEGVAAVEIMAGQAGHVNYTAIPNVIYTSPEAAWVGANEQELTSAGIAYKVGKFPFMANARAKAMAQTEGFVKIIADAKTDQVLGVHIIGEQAGNMIAEGVVALEFGACAEDIARISHAHPTEMEAMREAALAVDNRTRQL